MRNTVSIATVPNIARIRTGLRPDPFEWRPYQRHGIGQRNEFERGRSREMCVPFLSEYEPHQPVVRELKIPIMRVKINAYELDNVRQ